MDLIKTIMLLQKVFSNFHLKVVKVVHYKGRMLAVRLSIY